MIGDLSVVIKIKEGDIGAFEKVFRHYYEPLCRYAATFTKDADASEEIVQELFYTLWQERAGLHVFLSLKSYLYRSVRNNALQYLEHLDVRVRYREKAMHEQTGNAGNTTPLENLEYKELQKQIAALLDSMPERRRRIFMLHRFEGITYPEIARQLSVSVKTVEAEMSKALQAFKKITSNR